MLISAFLTYIRCELNYSVHTVSAYRRDLLQWAEYATGGAPEALQPMDVTSSDLRQWLSSLALNGATGNTIRRKAQSLRAFYRFLMTRHGMKDNPASEVQLPRRKAALPAYIRPEETKRLLDEQIDQTEFISTRNRLIMLTLYSTGIRSSELINLKDSDISLSRAELKVHGKRNKDRIIPFGMELAQMIIDYRELRDKTIDKAEAFFVRPSGEPLYRSLLYNIVHSTLKGAGVHAPKLSPHVLRHSFATDMLNNDANITSVQQLLGHQSLMTTQVYTHITYRELKQNYQLAHPRALKKGG